MPPPHLLTAEEIDMTAGPATPVWRPTFTDTAGRTWRVDVTAGLVAAHGAAALDRLDAGLRAGELRANARLLVEVLYGACEAQANAAGVGPEAFGRALARPDVIDRGGAAFVTALEIWRAIVATAGRVSPAVLQRLADAFHAHAQTRR